VSYYQVKISEGCFVWAVPTALRGRPYLNIALNLLRCANNVVDSNPAHVEAREEVQNVFFTYLENAVRNDVKQSVGLVVTSHW
jgi:hypothetical protein